MSKKPEYMEYASSKDKNIKDYITDVLQWLKDKGDARLENFDFEILERLPKETWDPRSMLKTSEEMTEEEQEFINKITGEFGNDLWGEMFDNKIDFRDGTKDNIQEAIEIMRGKIGAKNKNSARVMGPLVRSNQQEAQNLLDSIYDEAKDGVYATLQLGQTELLDQFIEGAKENLARIKKNKPDVEDSETYQAISNLVLESENIIELMNLDDEQQTAFYNNLINDFIEEETADNNPEHEMGRVQVLWRQIYSDEMEQTPVNGLVAVLFDLKTKQLRPVVMCLHGSIMEDIEKAFVERLESVAAQKFVMNGVMDFLNTHKGDAMKYVNARKVDKDDDNSLFAANVSVAPEVQAPSAAFVRSIIERVSEHGALDIDEELKNLLDEED